MSSAGRAVSSSGCVARPRGREIGLIGFAAQIRRSSLIGSYVMETAEHREPCESRGSRTVLGARGGEIPPRDSTKPIEFEKGKNAISVASLDKLPVIINILITAVRNGELDAQLAQAKKALTAVKSP